MTALFQVNEREPSNIDHHQSPLMKRIKKDMEAPHENAQVATNHSYLGKYMYFSLQNWRYLYSFFFISA